MCYDNSDCQEGNASFNQQTPLECPQCEHQWGYTGDLAKATCPSCLRKVNVEKHVRVAADGRGETLEMIGYSPENLPGGFDVDVTFDTGEKAGKATVHLPLDKEECEELWDAIAGSDGHEYPEDARQRLLDALGFPV